MQKILFISIILVSAIIISCNEKRELSKAEMKNIVEEQNQLLGECFKSGDAEKVASLYSDSAKLSPNGNDFIFGKEKIKEFWAEDFKSSQVKEMKTTVLTIDGNEDVIYETGKANSLIIYNDSTYDVTVKYINVWRKQTDGKYKLDVDFWNKDGK